MSLHIHRFIDTIKAAESRGQRDITLTLREAKDLHNDITKLLLNLQDKSQASNSNITIEMSGGSFKNPR